MSEENSLPVLLFAFATEDSSIQVEEEARAIQSAMADVSGGPGLCRIEIPPFLKLSDVVDTFQKNRNRISIFHYAGHANGAELLLRTASGSGASAAGMSTAIRSQSGLKLVFLNGCSTEKQVQEWLNAGVPCVIATVKAVHGEVAKNFAARFYAGLASGASIRTAYEEAVGEAQATVRGNVRLCYDDDDEEASQPAGSSVDVGTYYDHWPWFMKTAPGAEAAADWNLPDAAGDPLALLPLPMADYLPDSPYPGLRRFTAKDAAVFFGRGKAIRRLYERVTSASSAPIIMLHGQSGVGKSSILEAGLNPRLQISHNGSTPYDVTTVRIDPERGVLNALIQGLRCQLNIDAEKHSAEQIWQAIEAISGQPLLIILDQLEEAFTHAAGTEPADWGDFIRLLDRLFSDRAKSPKGKLILAFRTEWFSRINSRLTGLWKDDVFLDCLDATGIQEAIDGPTRRAELRNKYKLTIDDGLPQRIAAELLVDQETSVAPTLQVLLEKLWNESNRLSRQPHFTETLYRRHKATMGEFVRKQIQTIESDPTISSETRQAVDAGLLLDFLECHVTSELTSRHQSVDELVNGNPTAIPPLTARYPGRRQIIEELRRHCIDKYLLVQPDSGSNDCSEMTSRLAHDSLAVHIHNAHQASDAAGPQARRILEQRAAEWKQGLHDDLDGPSLKAVEKGIAGMRAWSSEEHELVATGRYNRRKRRLMTWAAGLTLFIAAYWSMLAWFSQEVKTAFNYDAANVDRLFSLTRYSPWLSKRRARQFFAEEQSDRERATKGEQPIVDAVELRKRSRRGLRAAMVMVDLDVADQKHYERLLDEFSHFDQLGDETEFRAVRDVLVDQNRWEKWGHLLPENLTELGPVTPAMALLLSANQAEAIPEEWFAPSPDQSIRTQLIAELEQWMTTDDLIRCIGLLTAKQKVSANADEQWIEDLLAVLCLAIAETPTAELREWLSEQEPPRQTDIEVLRWQKTSGLRSAATLLLNRLSDLGEQFDFSSDTESNNAAKGRLVSNLSENVTISGMADAQWATVTIKLKSQLPIQMDFNRVPIASGAQLGEERWIWMSATEVPRELFDGFRIENQDPACWHTDLFGRPDPLTSADTSHSDRSLTPPRSPATHVSWPESLNFCNWLSRISKLQPVYMDEANDHQSGCRPFQGRTTMNAAVDSANSGDLLIGFRLPTTTEWTIACRAASTTEYHFGDDSHLGEHDLLADYAWYGANSWEKNDNRIFQHVRACGTRLPNAWGFFDMMGNVREWCWMSDGRNTNVHRSVWFMLRSSSILAHPYDCDTFEESPTDDPQVNSPENGFRLVIDRLPLANAMLVK